LALVAALVAGGAGPAGAQQADPSARLVEEVAGLNRSLDQLVGMLQELMASQKIDLLIKRIEIKQRTLIPMASDLRSMEAEYSDLKMGIRRLQDMVEQQEEVVDREVLQGVDQPDSESRGFLAEMELELQVQTSRIEELDRSIRQLQDELAEGREEIEILDEQLRELLE
jgi:hypothetical protein